MPSRLWSLFLLLTTLLWSVTTSANPATSAETRVGTFDFASATLVGLSDAASPELHQGNRHAYGQLASGETDAARGVAQTANQVGRFRMTQTVANHAADVVTKGPFKGQLARPYLNSPHTIEEIMKAGKGVADPGGVPGALRWDVAGTFRGSEGTWELVVKGDQILHFNFVTP